MVSISFVMITARRDYPYRNRPELNIFEPTLESFKNQTYKDFEWVIVDALYEQRKDYFKKLDLPFHVKHVPAKPNIWIEHGLPGICRQYNKGIIYADGNLVFFTGEGYLLESHFMEQLWKRYQEGYFPLAWYLYDNTFSQFIQQQEWKEGIAENTKSPVAYNILGHTGQNVTIEHRYLTAFKGHDFKGCHAPWNWWFGCSSASLEAMLKINGFDENFDGDKMLLDCDVGSRLDLAGYSTRFALFRDIFLIRVPPLPGWNPNFKSDWTIKCNFGIEEYSRMLNRYRANTFKLTNADIEQIKNVHCGTICQMRDFCKKNHPWQFPFEHKAGYVGHCSSRRWFNFWKNHQEIIDLTEEREKRLSGNSKYAEGTFT
jgi:glycosyltransferase involved in cell wall biosynthesis